MERAYFIHSEARVEVGQQVEALADFPSVPRGSRGTVVKAQPYSGANYVLTVEWALPKRSTIVDLMVGDVSLNLFSRNKPVSDQFCKSEYQSLLKVLPRPF